MENKKTFIGYDLGDGESITDYVTLGIDEVSNTYKTNFIPMTMPGYSEPGRAIPTAFGYDENGKMIFAKNITIIPDMIHDIHVNFKRKPTDLIQNLSEKRYLELLKLFTEARTWPTEIKDCNSREMNYFRNAVITFTNAVFENPDYMEKVKSEIQDSSEVVFCVGHPTKWDDLDVAIYKLILKGSVLGKGTYAGKSSELIMAAESRAAYLTIKDKATPEVLPKGTSALLIDVGSSTIDLTCITANSHNYQYNSGNNYLGVRGIDYLIKEIYLEKLKKNPEDYINYKKFISYNDDFENAVTLACRLAKEDMYSSEIGIGRVVLGDFAPIRITKDDVDLVIKKKAVAPVLKEHISLAEKNAEEMGEMSWTELFEQFLLKQKDTIAKMNIRVGRIILTGSASKMPFVSEIVKKVFSELPKGGILADMNPSRSISMGLALVGPSNEKSKAFQEDINQLMEKELPDIVSKNLPQLADKLSNSINNIVMDIVKTRLYEWKRGKFRTLNDMTTQIEKDCNEKNLISLLEDNKEYKDSINNWLVDSIGPDIAVKLKAICMRYKVKDISIEDLNVFKVPSVKLGINIDVLAFTNVILNLVAVIAGIVAAFILPSVLGIIIGLISYVSVTLASFLLTVLIALPGVGWAILLGIAGVAVIIAARDGMEDAKNNLTRKLQSVDLPQWVRDRMTDDKIKSELKKVDMKTKIKEGILKEDSKDNIVREVVFNLRGQIEKRAEDIKYVIESV